MRVEVTRSMSTIVIAGRRFPAVTVICPPDEGYPDTMWNRALGAGTADRSVYIPAENGVLFAVDPNSGNDPRFDPSLMTLSITARTCTQSKFNDERPIWLPRAVLLIDGELVPEEGPRDVRGTFEWRNAEEEWVAETIERLSRKAFVQPDGPEVRLVPYGSVQREEE